MKNPIQVLILPFIIVNDKILFVIFKRSDSDVWQFISGGNEDKETLLETAKRECFEEASIGVNCKYYKLDSFATIPASIFPMKYRINWGLDCFVVKEYKFAVKLLEDSIIISKEHKEYRWVSYEEALNLLTYESNRSALAELNDRIRVNKLV